MSRWVMDKEESMDFLYVLDYKRPLTAPLSGLLITNNCVVSGLTLYVEYNKSRQVGIKQT